MLDAWHIGGCKAISKTRMFNIPFIYQRRQMYKCRERVNEGRGREGENERGEVGGVRGEGEERERKG